MLGGKVEIWGKVKTFDLFCFIIWQREGEGTAADYQWWSGRHYLKRGIVQGYYCSSTVGGLYTPCVVQLIPGDCTTHWVSSSSTGLWCQEKYIGWTLDGGLLVGCAQKVDLITGDWEVVEEEYIVWELYNICTQTWTWILNEYQTKKKYLPPRNGILVKL